jgi:hypothetical protein
MSKQEGSAIQRESPCSKKGGKRSDGDGPSTGLSIASDRDRPSVRLRKVVTPGMAELLKQRKRQQRETKEE